jgi:hypothetical protein
MSVYYLMNALNAIGEKAGFSHVSERPGEADVHVFYRCMTDPALAMMREMKTRRKLVVYAIDDWLFKPGFVSYPGTTHETFLKFMSEADIVAVPNRLLFAKVPTSYKMMYKVPFDRESCDLLKRKSREGDECAIGWLSGWTGRVYDNAICQILEVLEAESKPDERFVFHCFGDHDFGGIPRVEVVKHPYVPVEQWKELYQQIASLGLDVVINVLDEADEFCHCKAELKYQESAAMEVPLVTSRTIPFLEFIRDCENGFFASTPWEFVEKILFVKRNREAAVEVSRRARKHIEEECVSNVRAKRFVDDINAILRRQGRTLT